MTITATYAKNLTRRILAGSGAMTLVPYRIDPTRQVPVVLHGVDAAGRIIVVCHSDDAQDLPDAEVRVDCVKKALELSTNITVASLHGLGQLTWLPAGEAVAGLGLDPAPHLRFGVVELEQAHLHWPCGATMVRIAELGTLSNEKVADSEWEIRDALDSLGSTRLASLHTEVLTGLADGEVLNDREQTLCHQHRHNVWVGDVDEQGVMLIGSGTERISVTFVRFPERAASAEGIPAAVASLARAQ